MVLRTLHKVVSSSHFNIQVFTSQLQVKLCKHTSLLCLRTVNIDSQSEVAWFAQDISWVKALRKELLFEYLLSNQCSFKEVFQLQQCFNQNQRWPHSQSSLSRFQSFVNSLKAQRCYLMVWIKWWMQFNQEDQF